MFGSQVILNKQLNAISKEKANFWTMKQEKGTLIQYSTVNSQICLITGSWSNLVNEKPSITILFFAKAAPGIFGRFYCLGHGISERHRSSLDPRATWPCYSNAAPEPRGLARSSSCLCTKPPPPESRVNTAALVFGHPKVCTQTSPTWPRTPERSSPNSRELLASWGLGLFLQHISFRSSSERQARSHLHPWESDVLPRAQVPAHSSIRTKYVTTRAPGKLQPQNNQSTHAHSPEGTMQVEFTPISIFSMINNLPNTNSKSQAVDKGGLYNNTVILRRVKSQQTKQK